MRDLRKFPTRVCETRIVPEFCTCGAQLPPDARFCHKCGKPQFEMPEPEPEEVPIEAIRDELAKAPPPPPVGFGNPQAVRIGLWVGLLGFFTSVLSAPVVLLPMVCLLGAGFLSVYLYVRRTGQILSLRSGARMGWMTGLFAFVVVLVALTTIVLAVSDPNIASKLVAEVRARGTDINAQAMFEAFHNPWAIVQTVAITFVFFTVLPTLGGALGAKLLGRPR